MGLVVHESPSGALLKTPGGGSVANVYLGTLDSLEVALQAMRDRGWNKEADAVYAAMNAMTSRTLALKYPTMPTGDAVANWDQLRPVVVDIAKLYLSTDQEGRVRWPGRTTGYQPPASSPA